jgi:competence protein ComEA
MDGAVRTDSQGPSPLLRWADQACCVGLLSLALAAMIGTWIYQGGLRGRLIDVDRSRRREQQFQLDIQRADWTEWSLLPGVGETLARRIVLDRDTRGPFRDHDELQRVRGIGPRILDRMRPFLLRVDAGPRREGVDTERK